MAAQRTLLRIPALALCLSSTAAVQAAVLTVGPGGDHATIQAAIDAAVASPGGDDIRVARGTYHERLLVDTLEAEGPGTLRISGGWNAAFTSHDPDPNLTVVDADRLGRALHVACGQGAVEVLYFTLREGFIEYSVPSPDITGAGALLRARHFPGDEGCRVMLRNNAIIGGLVRKTGDDTFTCACGAGVSLVGQGVHELIDNTISGNEVHNEAAGGDAFGAGIFTQLGNAGRVVLSGNVISANTAEARNGEAHSVGLFLETRGSAESQLIDNVILRNRIVSPIPVPPFRRPSGATLLAFGFEDATVHIEARRNRVLENQGGTVQLEAVSRGSAEILFTDTLVAAGDADGVVLEAVQSGAIRASNLTTTDNASRGLVAQTDFSLPGELAVANSILFGNGAPDSIGPTVVLDSNLTSDPLFVNPAAGDYHLRLDSPAVNAGSNLPLGGLGPLDLDREPRLQGAAVDIGAYETDAPSGGGRGDGLCRLTDRSVIPFVPQWAPVCRCLRDDGLRALRCGGLGPGLFLEVTIPLPLIGGQPTEAEWTLHPWIDAAQGRYEFGASLLIGQKTEPVALKGKGTGKLAGKDAQETLQFAPPFDAATLRTTLRLFPPGANSSREIEMDVLLEPGTPQDPI